MSSQSFNMQTVSSHKTQQQSMYGEILNIKKKLLVTIHHVKIQISSNIDLKICCQCNDSETVYSQIQRVNQASRIANFKDEQICIPLNRIHGRQQIPKTNTSDSTISHGSDMVVCSIKLYAVSEARQKLIGVVNFGVDWQQGKSYKGKNHASLGFQKSIDSQAQVVLSTSLIDFEKELDLSSLSKNKSMDSFKQPYSATVLKSKAQSQQKDNRLYS